MFNLDRLRVPAADEIPGFQRIRRWSNMGMDSFDDKEASKTVGHGISWPYERAKEIDRRKGSVLNQWQDDLRQWIVLLASAVLTALISTTIDIVSSWLLSMRQGHCKGIWYASKEICCSSNASCPDWQPWPAQPVIFILLAVVFAGASAFLVRELAFRTVMSGVPELKAFFAGFDVPGFLGSRQLTVKSIGLCLSLASGLWLGQEGPLVYIACTAAVVLVPLIMGPLVPESKLRDVCLAAAASGVSLAFSAPIGGVLFILEIFKPAKRSILWQGFVCAMVSDLVFEIVNPFRTGKLLLYRVSYDRVWHTVELFLFAFLGCMGGVLGAALVKANIWFAGFWRSKESKVSPIVLVLAVSVISAALSYVSLATRMPHSRLLFELLQECRTAGPADGSLVFCSEENATHVVGMLLYAFFLVMILTPATYGLALPAGILLPSLLIGAVSGRLFGVAMSDILESNRKILNTVFCPEEGQCITPGVYALVGAGATLTGATKLTVASVVIIFEMTGALSYIVPVMAGVMFSKWTSDSIIPEGIYDAWVDFEKIPIIPDKPGKPLPNLVAVDVMKPVASIILIKLSDSVSEIKLKLDEHVYSYPIIDESRQLVGYITRRDLNRYLPTNPDEPFSIADFMNREVPVLLEGATLMSLYNYIRNTGYHTVYFVNRGELRGLITQVDLWRIMKPSSPPLLRREISYRASLDRELPEL